MNDDGVTWFSWLHDLEVALDRTSCGDPERDGFVMQDAFDAWWNGVDVAVFAERVGAERQS